MKNRKDIFYVVVIVFLLLMNYNTMNRVNHMSDKFDTYENTIAALNDSVSLKIENGINNWSQKAPQIDLKELTNSEYFKTLSKDQQAYYLELKKIKGLISSTQAELSKHGELLDKISKDKNPGTILKDSISFKLGTKLDFAESDTSKHLQWNSSVTLNKEIDFKFNYDYKVKMQITHERQKDKSIIVKYKIDDPDLKVNEMKNYIIPFEYPTKFNKWYDKNKRTINILGGSVLFLGGGYLGYKLAN